MCSTGPITALLSPAVVELCPSSAVEVEQQGRRGNSLAHSLTQADTNKNVRVFGVQCLLLKGPLSMF